MGALTKGKIVFDVTDLPNSDQIGAVLLETTGALLTADDDADVGNPQKMGTRGIEGVLTALSDTGDRADVISDLYRRIYINDSPNIAVLTAAVTIGLTAGTLPGTALAGRRRMFVQNLGSKPIFIGHSGVTTANGLEVVKGGTVSLEIGEDVILSGISDTAGQDVRVTEFA